MTKPSPQTTHNESDESRPSAYDMMNKEIETFISNVEEEERKSNQVMHAKAGTDENEKTSWLQQIAAKMSSK